MSTPTTAALNVVIAGGGVAGVEALLALRALAGDRVSLTLVTDGDELRLPALSVAEPFALGQAETFPLSSIAEAAGCAIVAGRLRDVDPARARIGLDDGTDVPFDALVIAAGARPVATIPHALTWWPGGDPEQFGGLLRDLEEGYARRVAFVNPPGETWPLPVYELALMTAREVRGMGIDDAQLTVVTPEAVPLHLFGPEAPAAVQAELAAAGVRLEAATVARVVRDHGLQLILQPTIRRLDVDRVVALPGLTGTPIPGTVCNRDGFVEVGPTGRMRGSDTVWAVGDVAAHPVKFGGLATQQADLAAADIAARAGAGTVPDHRPQRLQGTLMTGGAPVSLHAAPPASTQAPWRPADKVRGRYLTPVLAELRRDRDRVH